MFPNIGPDFDIQAYMREVERRTEKFEASGSDDLANGDTFFYSLLVHPDINSNGVGNWKIRCERITYPPISDRKSPSDIKFSDFEQQLVPFGDDNNRKYAMLAFETAKGLLEEGKTLGEVQSALQ